MFYSCNKFCAHWCFTCLDIEAGSQCPTGEGVYTFNTTHAQKLFEVVANIIKTAKIFGNRTGHHDIHLRINDLEGSSANGHTATNERPVTGTEYFGSPPSIPSIKTYENWSYVNVNYKLEYCTITFPFPDEGEVILPHQDMSLYTYLDHSETNAMAIIKAQRYIYIYKKKAAMKNYDM